MVWITLPNEFDEDAKQWIRHEDLPRMQNIVLNKHSSLDHTCALSVYSQPHKSVRSTNISCNIGSLLNRDVDDLLKLMQAGMNIARINLNSNHSDMEYHTGTVKNIRQAAENYSKILGVHYPVAIASDTVGSEVCTGYLEAGDDAEVELKKGNLVKLTTDPAYKDKCSAQVIYCDYEDIISKIAVGRFVYIDDGEIMLEILSISGAFFTCKIIMGGFLGNQRRVNLPGTKVDLPALSEIDKLYIDFAIKNKIDFLFCAFIKNKNAVLEIRKVLGKKGRHIKVISKIEDVQGYQNIDEIISVSDAIVIARGDLFMEFSYSKLFIAQKFLTAKCIRNGCPVIVSRDFMESMIKERVTKRAEVCDAANAVIDSCDVIMLTTETTRGNRGVEIVKMVSQICKEAEAIVWRASSASQMFNDWNLDTADVSHTISMTAVDASIKCRAAAIFVITNTGKCAKIVSQYRPRCPIVAITRHARVSRQLHLYRSVIPFLYVGEKLNDIFEDIDMQVAAAIKFGKDRLFIQNNEPLIIIIDNKHEKKLNNTMRIQYVSDSDDFIEDSMLLS